jgi:hypothetical protein
MVINPLTFDIVTIFVSDHILAAPPHIMTAVGEHFLPPRWRLHKWVVRRYAIVLSSFRFIDVYPEYLAQ